MEKYKVVPTKGDERWGWSVVDDAGTEWIASCPRRKADRICREMNANGYASTFDASDLDDDGPPTRSGVMGALLAFYLVVLFSSCTVSQPIGAAGPLDTATPLKVGTSASVCVLGITIRDGGLVRQAATAGGIHYVQTVDVRRTDILGLYVRSVTIVTGE